MQELKHRLLAKRQAERQRLYQAMTPLFRKFYKGRKCNFMSAHAKSLADEVARYTANAKDQKWAKASVIVASIHTFPKEMADDIRTALMRILPKDQTDSIINSFLCFNRLREQDELPPKNKDMATYLELARPYLSPQGLILLPPEVFVRTVDMSTSSNYFGPEARKLHETISIGPHDWMNQNLAKSILMVWRPASIQLMLFACYNQMSNIAARILYPGLYDKFDFLYRTIHNELEDVAKKFGIYLDLLLQMNTRIPLVHQTDRETREPALFRIRVKERGSATIKAVDKNMCDPEGKDFDPANILESIHDLVAGTLVPRANHDAFNFYRFILSHHSKKIIEHEDIFYGRHSGNGNSLSGYKGVGHIDFNASCFGAKNIQRTELHVRSYESYLAYYMSKTAGRGARDSKLIGDAWGDDNYKIVEALGRLDEHIDNGLPPKKNGSNKCIEKKTPAKKPGADTDKPNTQKSDKKKKRGKR